MPEVNFEWVRAQLAEAKAKVGPGNAVLQLLEVWEQQSKLTPNLAKEAVEMFSKLALGHSLKEEQVATDETWILVQPGNIKVGDEIRVLSDAFQDASGTLHNGRRGRIVAIRYGDVIMNSTDNKTPPLNGVHYSPYKLEKRVK
jgi:hypothetical protein